MLPDYLNTFPGQLVAWVIQEMRKFDNAATSWEGLPQDNRDERLDQMRATADELMAKIIDRIETHGTNSVQGVIESVLFKSGVKVVINASKLDPHILELAQKAGQDVTLLLPTAALEVDDRQQDLDLAVGTDTDEADALLDAIMNREADTELSCTCPPTAEGDDAVVDDYCPIHGNPPNSGELDPDDPENRPQPDDCTCDVNLPGTWDPGCPVHGTDRDDPESSNDTPDDPGPHEPPARPHTPPFDNTPKTGRGDRADDSSDSDHIG